MLLLKKLNPLAIAIMTVAPINALAAADVSSTAPAPASPGNPGVYYSVNPDEISKYISGFKVKKETSEGTGTHLSFLGLGSAKCLRHLRFEIENPNDYQSGLYAIRIERTDIQDGDKVAKAEDDCTNDITRNCTRDTCDSINKDEVAKNLKIPAVASTQLSVSTDVRWKIENRKLPEGHEDAVKYLDIPKLNGGPIAYKTPEDVAKEYEAQHKKEFNELLVSTCKEAQKGNRGDLDSLKEYLGEKKLEQHKKFIADLEKIVDDKEFENARKEASEDKSLSSGIDKLCEFGNANPKMKARSAEALLDLVKTDLDEFEGSDDAEKDINKAMHSRFLLAQKALKCAIKLDPKNKDYKKRMYAVKLQRFKFSAGTGSDRFYNEQTQREAFEAYRQVENWASRTRDPEVSGLAKDYRKSFAETLIPTQVQTPYGMAQTYVPGTNLDRQFVARSLEEEFRTYRSSRLFDSSTTGGSYNLGGSGGPSNYGGNSSYGNGSGGYGNNRY